MEVAGAGKVRTFTWALTCVASVSRSRFTVAARVTRRTGASEGTQFIGASTSVLTRLTVTRHDLCLAVAASEPGVAGTAVASAVLHTRAIILTRSAGTRRDDCFTPAAGVARRTRAPELSATFPFASSSILTRIRPARLVSIASRTVVA